MSTEFEEASNLLDSNRDAVTISIEDSETRPEKQRKNVGFTQDDEDPDASDDQTEVWTRFLICELG